MKTFANRNPRELKSLANFEYYFFRVRSKISLYLHSNKITSASEKSKSQEKSSSSAQIKSRELKSGFSKEDFLREMSESRLILRKAMAKNLAIKSSPRSTSTIVELIVRNQKSENNEEKIKVTNLKNSLRHIENNSSYLQLKQNSFTKYWITRYEKVF